MAQYDFQSWEFLKDAAQDKTQRVGSGFDRKSPDRSHQDRIVAIPIAIVIGLHDRLVRNGWMQINGHVERRSLRKDRPEFFVVEKAAVGEATDQRAFKSEIDNRSFQ